MKRVAFLTLLTLSLAACQKKDTATTDSTTTTTDTATTPAATDTAATETATPAADTPATDTATADPARTDTAATATATDTATTPAATDTAKTDTPAATDTASSAQSQPAALPSGYTLVPALSQTPVRTFAKAPAYQLTDGKDYFAVIDTDKGQIVADLLEKQVPTTVNNFVYLAREHFYDGQRFHRVIDGFMAQTGDPKSTDEAQKAAWGTGDPGYKFPDEIRSSLTFDQAGMLAMANSGPNTNGSQFFITFGATPNLNGGYSLFGKVVSGEDVLPKLTRTADGSQGGEAPIAGATPDKLLSVRIVTKP
ncbi:peptidylprolyl isomerase [Deinococcus sp.]|uniref:peptidylprolyl isomerase n=1 Tax=Deinococcus sp. TaxID=47478 RepID=UPI003B5CB14C